MIQLDDTIIQADMQDVLTVLKSELAAKGVERFRTFRLNGNNIQTNCPFHKNGQERRPSFGINIHNGQAHCFTCGWGGSLDEMISELMGYLDNGKHGFVSILCRSLLLGCAYVQCETSKQHDS